MEDSSMEIHSNSISILNNHMTTELQLHDYYHISTTPKTNPSTIE